MTRVRLAVGRAARGAKLMTLGLAVTSGVWGCAIDDADEIADDWMHGTMMGHDFRAGPGGVTIESGGSAIIRLFEDGVIKDACAANPVVGYRIEIHMAQFLTGRYEAANNEGWYAEAWKSKEGTRDPYSLIEIDVAQKQVGGEVLGRARFGSAQAGDLVEGRFEAVVCAIEQ